MVNDKDVLGRDWALKQLAEKYQKAADNNSKEIAAIKDAIAKIAAGDEAAWAKDGKPKTEAIAAITGWPVNATERNEIWEAVKPAQVAAAVNDMSANAGTATA